AGLGRAARGRGAVPPSWPLWGCGGPGVPGGPGASSVPIPVGRFQPPLAVSTGLGSGRVPGSRAGGHGYGPAGGRAARGDICSWGRGGSRRVLGRNFLPVSHSAPLRGGCLERRLQLSRLAHGCPGVGFFSPPGSAVGISAPPAPSYSWRSSAGLYQIRVGCVRSAREDPSSKAWGSCASSCTSGHGVGCPVLTLPPPRLPQRPVCHRAEVSGEENGPGVRGQVHQEAAALVQPARREPGGDREGGGHPAGDPAPQHHHAARHLREQNGRGADPGAGLGGRALRFPGREGVPDGGGGHPVPQADPGRGALPALQAHRPLRLEAGEHHAAGQERAKPSHQTHRLRDRPQDRSWERVQEHLWDPGVCGSGNCELRTPGAGGGHVEHRCHHVHPVERGLALPGGDEARDLDQHIGRQLRLRRGVLQQHQRAGQGLHPTPAGQGPQEADDDSSKPGAPLDQGRKLPVSFGCQACRRSGGGGFGLRSEVSGAFWVSDLQEVRGWRSVCPQLSAAPPALPGPVWLHCSAGGCGGRGRRSRSCCPGRAPRRGCPSPQVIKRRNVRNEDNGKKPERRRLKTTRLKEYTIKSHSSMPPNNTYINFERFSKVMEEVAAAEESLRELERNKKSYQEDIEALLSIYEEKESWYKEENESISQDLRQIRQELQKTEALKKQTQEETKSVLQAANGLKRRYRKLENHYEALAKQVASEMKFVQELVWSIEREKLQSGEGDGSIR
uniref:Uncharacterized protein n=1 Tax=Anas zonorhyncha TaxID=75864 RepID=A0A8B9US52_9AVES